MPSCDEMQNELHNCLSLDADALPLRPQLIEYERPKTAPAVTQDEIRATEHTIERLQFEMATMVREDNVLNLVLHSAE